MRIPKTRVIVDRFLRTFSLHGSHIDHTDAQLNVLSRIYINAWHKDVDKSSFTPMSSISSNFEHKDVDKSSAAFIFSIPAAFAHKDVDKSMSSFSFSVPVTFTHKDVDRSDMKPLLKCFAKPEDHIDEDRSSLQLMQVRPVFLESLSNLTLGELAAIKMGDMNYERI